MPRLNTETDKWLAQIDKRIRTLTGIIASSGAANDPIQFTIGDGNPGTPLNGATVYPNANLEDKTIKVFKNGVGYLTEGVHYDLYDGGGIELLASATFSDDETYLIWII